MLHSKQDNGAVVRGELYRIEKTWSKGDVYDGNKRAKGHGFDLFHLKLNTAFLKKIEDFHNTAMGKDIPKESGKPKI